MQIRPRLWSLGLHIALLLVVRKFTLLWINWPTVLLFSRLVVNVMKNLNHHVQLLSRGLVCT